MIRAGCGAGDATETAWQFCQEQDMATGPNEHPACDYEGTCSNTAGAQGQEERAKPKSQKALPKSFSLSGINFPTCKSGQLGGRHSGTLEVRWRGLTSDLSHIHTARGDRSSPDGLYVAHMGFSHLKCELSFKHPRSLPQHPGFQVLKKTN